MLDQQEPQGQRVTKVHPVLQELVVQKVIRVILETQDLLEEQDHPEPKVTKETLVL